MTLEKTVLYGIMEKGCYLYFEHRYKCFEILLWRGLKEERQKTTGGFEHGKS